MTIRLNNQDDLNKLMDIFEKLNLIYDIDTGDRSPSSLKVSARYFLFPSNIYVRDGMFGWGAYGRMVPIDHLEGKPINYVLR